MALVDDFAAFSTSKNAAKKVLSRFDEGRISGHVNIWSPPRDASFERGG